jgi:hypothetical protein
VETKITVTKDALTTSVPETGGDATYQVTVQNTSALAVTLTSLTDNKYGVISATHAANASCTGSATPGSCLEVKDTTCVADADPATCQVGGSIAAGGSCSCTFKGPVPPGDSGGKFTDTVEVCANNASNPTPSCKTDPADVTYTNVPERPTLTKTATNPQCRIDVTYNVVVQNTSSQDTLTLNTLTDDIYGDITTAAGASCTGTCIVSTTCGQASGAGVLPASIATSGNYSCSFVGRISSCNTTVKDTVSATATDDDNTNYPLPGETLKDDATVVVTVTTPTP